ncbi:MAG: hypothetical protein L0H73_18085, partial [Nitrococcus sp.]|nr:hypothetical protein [Nitrococcus sp.]
MQRSGTGARHSGQSANALQLAHGDGLIGEHIEQGFLDRILLKGLEKSTGQAGSGLCRAQHLATLNPPTRGADESHSPRQRVHHQDRLPDEHRLSPLLIATTVAVPRLGAVGGKDAAVEPTWRYARRG